MATQEIYIRNATETEARGPFNAQQVADLAEAGQVTGETLIYDAGAEEWVALTANAELMAAVFPAKRKLELKAREIKTLNQASAETAPISVDDMLAAAEGRTGDTRGKADPQIAMAQAAKLGMYGALLTLVLAAAGEIVPAASALVALDWAKLGARPLVLLGVVDLALAVFLGLGMTSLYPFIRFRAALGLGLMGFIYYVQGDSLPLLAVAAGSVSLFLCTLVVSVLPAVMAVAIGVGGMGLLAWLVISR